MRIFDAIGDYFTTADESAQAVSDVATTAAEVVSDSNGFTAVSYTHLTLPTIYSV